MRTLLCLLVVALWACSPDTVPTPTAATPPSSEPPSESSTSSTAAPSSTSSSTSSTVDEGRTLRIGSLVRPTSLDPASAYTLADWELLHAVAEGPLVRQAGDGELMPGIAADLPEVTDDGRTYTFRLADDATFADGSQITASLYAQQLRRVMDLGGQASDLVTSFVQSIEAPDDDTVVVRLRTEVAFFPTLLAGAPYVALPPDTFPEAELVAFPETPVLGSGTWSLTSQSPEELVLDRREAPGTGVDRIVITYHETVEDVVTAIRAGDVDVLWRGLDSRSASSLGQGEGVVVEEVPGGTIHFLLVNHRTQPTNDPRVRRALAEVVDRDALTDAVDQELDPQYSPVPSGFLGATNAFRDVYGEPDASTAIDLLTEAGYTTAEPAELELAYPPERYGVELAQAMEELEQQIEATGLVQVTLTAQPWNTYVGDVVDGAYDLAFLGWLYDFPDPHAYLAPFIVDGGMGASADPGGLEQPEIVDLVDEAASEPDEDRREELYRTIQQLHAEDVITLPLWMDTEFVAYRDGVSGDPDGAFPETLNIGPSMQLDYDVLRLSDDE